MNLFYKQYIFGFPFSEKPKKTRTDKSIFLLSLKRNYSQTFKSSNCKKAFIQCVCYW